jgi:ketosteroid isomerase-like protein
MRGHRAAELRRVSGRRGQWIDAADRLVVTGRFRGRAKNGQELDAPFAHVSTMRNGKAVRFEHYVDQPSWSRACGG